MNRKFIFGILTVLLFYTGNLFAEDLQPINSAEVLKVIGMKNGKVDIYEKNPFYIYISNYDYKNGKEFGSIEGLGFLNADELATFILSNWKGFPPKVKNAIRTKFGSPEQAAKRDAIKWLQKSSIAPEMRPKHMNALKLISKYSGVSVGDLKGTFKNFVQKNLEKMKLAEFEKIGEADNYRKVMFKYMTDPNSHENKTELSKFIQRVEKKSGDVGLVKAVTSRISPKLGETVMDYRKYYTPR